MTISSIGARKIDPAKDDFFRAIIEERKTLPKKHPHYLLLKIIANSLYGIFAELNKYEYGKNKAKQLEVFSGEHKFDQTTCVVERPGKWHFPPAAALITAGGRLMLAILEDMVESQGGTYLLTDTDSMLFVASEKGGLVPCPGGPHRMANGDPAVEAITWKQVKEFCAKLNRLNPYDRSVVGEILKVEDCNKDRAGNQHQLYGLAVSAKRYVVYTRRKLNIEVIKPSEHGLGTVYVPDERRRYKPADCKDQETTYPRWIVEAWERLLLPKHEGY
jgi:DNA polymerase elongation subunit (family B)